jgi:putative ABC transport system permease protein
MVVDTDLGAAPVVARQLAVALRPDDPGALTVVPPPDPHTLRDNVQSDLNTLFMLLAAVSLIIGMLGIANTTLVAVLERTGEIGLRRALGARRRHITAQFLTESAAIGTIGGLVGAALGVVTVVAIAVVRDWTPILDLKLLLPAPLGGTAIGLLAGLQPAARAARIPPAEAFRR